MTAAKPARPKRTFTTGEIAEILGTAPRTVTKFIDTGQLNGYRLPGSGDRRVPRDELLRFMREHKMPTAAVEAKYYRNILVVGAEPLFVGRLREVLTTADGFRIQEVETPFDAGWCAATYRPEGVVIDLAIGRDAALALARSVRQHPAHRKVMLIALANEDEADPGCLVEYSFNGVLKKPVDAALLAEGVRRFGGVTNGHVGELPSENGRA